MESLAFSELTLGNETNINLWTSISKDNDGVAIIVANFSKFEPRRPFACLMIPRGPTIVGAEPEMLTLSFKNPGEIRVFSELSFKNPEEIRDNPKSVRDSWEKAKSREPPGESGTVGNYVYDFFMTLTQ